MLLTSAHLPDILYNPSNGYLLLLDACGRLSVWLGKGWSTEQFIIGSRLLDPLLKSCVQYNMDVANPKFPWWVISTSTINVNAWSHVTFMYSNITGVFSLLVNGAVEASYWSIPLMAENIQSPLYFGGSLEGEVAVLNLSGYTGAMDELLVYDLAVPSWFIHARVLYGLKTDEVAIVNTRILGVSTGCQLQNAWPTLQTQSNCLVVLSGPQSPVIYTVSPTFGAVGDTFTVLGSNLAPPSQLVLLLNNVQVPVVTSSSTGLTFVLPDLAGHRGAVNIAVRVNAVGRAVGSLKIVSQVEITSFSPSVGSVGGGLAITFVGKGFSTTPGAMTVWLGSLTLSSPNSDATCTIPTSGYAMTSTSFTCLTSESAEGLFNLNLESQDRSLTAHPLAASYFVCSVASGCKFEFAMRRTPVISSFTPLEVTDGAIVSVFGVGCVMSECSIASAWLCCCC